MAGMWIASAQPQALSAKRQVPNPPAKNLRRRAERWGEVRPARQWVLFGKRMPLAAERQGALNPIP